MNSIEHRFGALFQMPELQGIANSPLAPLFHSALLSPLEEFLNRPKKGFRRDLMRLGYHMVQESLNVENNQRSESDPDDQLQLFETVIELIHSGSLIVDDIEDETAMRRGKPSLHKIYGVPLALNAGNWLYFWPLIILQNSKLSDSIKQAALAECQKTLVLAHTGQALDLGAPLVEIPRHRVSEVVLQSLKLKSGSLTALSLKLGALAAFEQPPGAAIGTVERELISLNCMGLGFGQLLQMYDDVGNLRSLENPQKRFEDLKFMRPSFVWMALAEILNDEEYTQFLRATHDRRSSNHFNQWIEQQISGLDLFDHCKTLLKQKEQEWLTEIKLARPNLAKHHFTAIKATLERLSHAY